MNDIKERRKAMGLTQLELAHRTGFRSSYICDLENGKANPRPATLERISDALDGKRAPIKKVRVPFRDIEEEAELNRIFLRDWTPLSKW